MMFRIIVTSIVAACLALAFSYGQVVEPIFICSADKVGYTYPAANPLSFYTCKDANTPLLFDCPQNTGYISNGTLTGCVPWVLWECTSKTGAPNCTEDQQLLKYPNVQPNLFWICQGINLTQALPCPDGSAFIPSGNNSGCKPWNVWSQTCPY